MRISARFSRITTYTLWVFQVGFGALLYTVGHGYIHTPFVLINDVVARSNVSGAMVVALASPFIFQALFRIAVGMSRRRSPGSQHPPLNAEFLFYLFMAPQNCDALVGDLEERYKLIHKKFGRRRANFWYWTQTVMSLGPIVWAWAKKVVMKPVVAIIGWAITKGLIGHDGWLVAVVELLKKVRP